MTTFQDPQPQSRRAARERERALASENAERSATGEHVFDFTEQRMTEPVADERPTGRRSSGEPEAEERPQFRMRDFSPEGRFAPTTPEVAPGPPAAPQNLDYRTQMGPVGEHPADAQAPEVAPVAAPVAGPTGWAVPAAESAAPEVPQHTLTRRELRLLQQQADAAAGLAPPVEPAPVAPLFAEPTPLVEPAATTTSPSALSEALRFAPPPTQAPADYHPAPEPSEPAPAPDLSSPLGAHWTVPQFVEPTPVFEQPGASTESDANAESEDDPNAEAVGEPEVAVFPWDAPVDEAPARAPWADAPTPINWADAPAPAWTDAPAPSAGVESSPAGEPVETAEPAAWPFAFGTPVERAPGPVADAPVVSEPVVEEPPAASTESDFLQPPVARASYTPPANHWSRMAEQDDNELVPETTLSREVGASNVTTTTSALILPSIPQADFASVINGTGEILVTGTISLPESLGTLGGDARNLDHPDVDRLMDAFDNEIVSNDSAPVRAIRAVSTHTSTNSVIAQPPKQRSNRLFTVGIIATGVLVLAVVGLLAVYVLKM